MIVMLRDDMEHFIRLPSMAKESVGTDSELKHLGPEESHQIRLLSRILDHIMELQQNTDGATVFLPMIASQLHK